MSRTNLVVETDACPACGGYNIELIETNYGDDMTKLNGRLKKWQRIKK